MKLTCPTGTKTLTLKENEEVTVELEDLESGNRKFELIIELIGANAVCHVTGRANGSKTDQKTWKVTQKFQGQDQTGTLDLRGVGEGESCITFDGSAVLERTSTGATAEVAERILLFGQAQGRGLPVLTVHTNNVTSATHRASISPVNPEKLLYLQSRGIPELQAQELIKSGFLA